jgi:MYXO-CTERM domain-containing protein
LNRRLRALGTIVAALAAAIVMTGSATGHSGEWGIFPDSPTSWPGAGLRVRGDLPSTGPIDLVIVSPGLAAPLATIDDAPNGHFETTVTVPPALTPGAWEIQARASGMEVVRATLTLVAAPPPGEDDDETEAYPTGAPRASVGSESGSTVGDVSSPLLTPSAETDLVPLAAAGLAVLALAALVRRTRRRDLSR